MTRVWNGRWRGRTLGAALLAACAGSSVSAGDLPAGAVVAFIPATVCAKLPGGWRDFAEADGRVVVGMAPGLAASGPALSNPAVVEYWNKGVTLQPGMIPHLPVAGAGPSLTTAPVVTINTGAAPRLGAAFASATPNMRLFGYRSGFSTSGAFEALAAGYGAPGAVGKDVPDPAPTMPPFVALRYCVKR